MSIKKIDQDRCIGCGRCVSSCPADVIRMDPSTKKAYAKYPEECVVCCWCISECPMDAIVITPEKDTVYFTSMG